MSECSSSLNMQNTYSFTYMSHMHVGGMVMVKIHFMCIVYAGVV
jgi:hypothetical protein